MYDLGGGTFDVSIVKMKGTEAEVLATEGRTFLGGEDFDYRLYEEAVSEFKGMGPFSFSHGEEFRNCFCRNKYREGCGISAVSEL